MLSHIWGNISSSFYVPTPSNLLLNLAPHLFSFQFKQNPYFANAEIEKEFHLHDDELPSGPTSTAIQWHPGKSLVAKATNGAGSKRKNEEVQVSFLE